MIIERKFGKGVNFETLNIGDCFDFNDCVYIKMEPTGTYEHDKEYVLHNAFWVNESMTVHFNGDDKVIPLKMKLVEV